MRVISKAHMSKRNTPLGLTTENLSLSCQGSDPGDLMV